VSRRTLLIAALALMAGGLLLGGLGTVFGDSAAIGQPGQLQGPGQPGPGGGFRPRDPGLRPGFRPGERPWKVIPAPAASPKPSPSPSP
jgi:hypothetical protein